MVSLILGTHANLDPITAVKAVTASYFLALGAYVYNDMTDLEVDKINRTNRPSVTGKATGSQLANLVSFLFGFSLLLVASLNFYALFISIFFILLGIAYSHQRFNLKDKFPLKTVVTASGAALLSLMGGAAVIGISLPVIYAALFFFAFFFILGPLGDIGDLKGDRAGGRRTFPIVLGMKPTLMIMLSVPIVILSLTVSSDIILHLNSKTFGIYPIVGTSLATLALLVRISKRLNDVSVIKSTRPKMRYLHVLMQISLLVAFL
jgi:geranylgeranylglycerol-phosphate geranylgeranyltransferase